MIICISDNRNMSLITGNTFEIVRKNAVRILQPDITVCYGCDECSKRIEMLKITNN